MRAGFCPGEKERYVVDGEQKEPENKWREKLNNLIWRTEMSSQLDREMNSAPHTHTLTHAE